MTNFLLKSDSIARYWQDLSHLPPVLDAIAVTGPFIFRGDAGRGRFGRSVSY